MIPNQNKIINKAGPVFRPVPYVKLFHPPAGKFPAFIAKPGFSPGQVFAWRNNAPLNAPLLVSGIYPATRTMVFRPLVGQAGATVHPAGGNQQWIKLYPVYHKMVKAWNIQMYMVPGN
jgi:hypothetical protein